ncbi:hypothetical protein [Reyranella sp.]|uniref:hypothetical protein n=1 Tax=Reyranella sp. TaxID=1929291 RepID=UPI003D0E4BD8
MSGRYQTYTFNSPTIEDPYFLLVQTGDGKIRFGGIERGPDGVPREIFAIQLPGRTPMYGEWTQKFASNGNDFDVEIVSFGFPPLYSVAGPAGLETFCVVEREAVQKLIAALFSDAAATGQLFEFAPERKGLFLNRIHFRPDWIRYS